MLVTVPAYFWLISAGNEAVYKTAQATPGLLKTVTFNLFIIIYGRIVCLKLDNAISLKPKNRSLLPFLYTKPLIAMKILGHHDKHLTPSESWYEDGFF